MNAQNLTVALSEVKEWLKTQPHMPQCASEDEAVLEAFIQGYSPYLSLAMLKLDAYYSFRGEFSQPYFRNRDPNKIKWYSVMKYIMLEERTPEGDHVLLVLPPTSQIRYYSAEESRKLLLMVLDSHMRQHRGHKLSLYLVVDAANLTQELVDKHSDDSSTFNLILEVYPIKIKAVVWFNTDENKVDLCSQLYKEFCSAGSLAKSQLERGSENLVKYLPLEILPRDYIQGNNLPLKALWDGVQQRLERERDWFVSAGSQTTNEVLRP